jgi:hypothetical protein
VVAPRRAADHPLRYTCAGRDLQVASLFAHAWDVTRTDRGLVAWAGNRRPARAPTGCMGIELYYIMNRVMLNDESNYTT